MMTAKDFEAGAEALAIVRASLEGYRERNENIYVGAVAGFTAAVEAFVYVSRQSNVRFNEDRFRLVLSREIEKKIQK